MVFLFPSVQYRVLYFLEVHTACYIKRHVLNPEPMKLKDMDRWPSLQMQWNYQVNCTGTTHVTTTTFKMTWQCNCMSYAEPPVTIARLTKSFTRCHSNISKFTGCMVTLGTRIRGIPTGFNDIKDQAQWQKVKHLSRPCLAKRYLLIAQIWI